MKSQIIFDVIWVYRNLYHARDPQMKAHIIHIIIWVYRNLYHARDP